MPIVPISLSEFRAKFFGYRDLFFEEEVVGGEIVFESAISKGYCLRIFTSITEGEDEVRDEGQDAIRSVVVNEDGDVVKSEPYTKRTPRWDERLKQKIDSLAFCPDCRHGRLFVANGEYGDYWFCENDQCEYIESVEK